MPFQKRWFFVQGGILCYMDPEAGKADNAIVCGQITASDISSRLKYELSIFAGGRHYFLRVDTIAAQASRDCSTRSPVDVCSCWKALQESLVECGFRLKGRFGTALHGVLTRVSCFRTKSKPSYS